MRELRMEMAATMSGDEMAETSGSELLLEKAASKECGFCCGGFRPHFPFGMDPWFSCRLAAWCPLGINPPDLERLEVEPLEPLVLEPYLRGLES